MTERRNTFYGGLHQGPDAYPTQVESDQLRRVLAQRSPAHAIRTNCGHFIDASVTSSIAWTVDMVYLCPIQVNYDPVQLMKCIIAVETGIGSPSNLKVCLYHKGLDNQQIVRKIPNTDAFYTLQAAGTGTKIFNLPGRVIAPGNSIIYLGWVWQSNPASLYSSPSVSTKMPYKVKRKAGTTLDAQFFLYDFANNSIEVPYVVYPSPLVEGI